mgnify:FL=1
MHDLYREDVYTKKESRLAKYQFTQEIVYVYVCGVHNGMLELDCQSQLHKAATKAFPTE